MIARLLVRVRSNAGHGATRLAAGARAMGRPGRAAALGMTAALVSAVIGLAAPEPGPAPRIATMTILPAQPGAVIVVSAAVEEVAVPAAVEVVFVVATAEPTASPVPTAAKPQPPAVAAAQEASAASVGTVAAPVAGKQYTADEVIAFARQAGWPDSLASDVLTVAVCESSLFSGARGGQALGLMQIVGFWFDKAGIDASLWSDPVANLRVAYYVYTYGISNGDAPWSAWGCKPLPHTPVATATATPTVAAPPVVAAPSPVAKNTALSAAPAERH